MAADEARIRSRQLWSRVAPEWERQRAYLWETARHVSEWMVARVNPRPGQTILELAGGPGDTGFLAAALVGSAGRVISTDFSEDMVRVARRRAGELGLTNVETRVMDAERMDLPDASVDGVLCRWGLMLTLDAAAALAETRRVLRLGGRLAFSVWGSPQDNPWATTLPRVLVGLGKMQPLDPTAPGGVFSLADHALLRALVAGAGFGEPEIEDIPVTWRFDDFDGWWRFQTELAVAIAQFLEGLSAAELGEVREAVREASSPFAVAGGYELPGMTVNVAVA